MHHTELCLDIPSRGSDAIVCHSVTLGPVFKSGITSRGVLSGVACYMQSELGICETLLNGLEHA